MIICMDIPVDNLSNTTVGEGNSWWRKQKHLSQFDLDGLVGRQPLGSVDQYGVRLIQPGRNTQNGLLVQLQ